MNPSSTDPFCDSCKKFKPVIEFMGHDAKNTPKRFQTCNYCRQRFSNKRKRSANTDDTFLANDLEIVELDCLSEIVVKFLESTQSGLHFHYGISIRDYNGSDKELANEIVKLIENADEYN
ncbi:17232_t:CDS:1 [Cetraspora pellucida]|uniref:17232_t:CDS:1 n=1 Tax=Cetraspora pellucida TaxID=1433469 RepID=A0A9N9EVM7_9GLOM|nr:17232_t:CDS:1 [Cetraspora pellucida]